MYVIFIIAWILSPLALIPVVIKKSVENSKLKRFIDDLCRCGRISVTEYANRKAEKSEEPSSKPKETVSAPVFTDNCEFSKVHGGNYVNAELRQINAASEKGSPKTDTAAKPSKPEVKPEANKYTYDLPVYSISENESAADKKEPSAFAAAASVKPAAVRTECEKSAVCNNKESTAPPTEKRAAAMSVLLMIGIIFVILAGLVFSTAVWATLGDLGRTCSIGIVSALFFGISAFAGKKLKLERTAFAFYTLGTFFSAITLLTAGFFGLTGTYFSVSGKGGCLLYAAALLIICLLSAKGRSIFDIPAAAFISALSGAFSAVLILVQLSTDTGVFALLASVFTAAANALVYVRGKKISVRWEKPLHIAAALLNAAALTGGISAAFGNSPAFYAAAVIFVLRSTAAAIMAFKGHCVYKTRLAAVSSLAAGTFFALLILFKSAASPEIFALSAAVFGILFALGMFTFDLPFPEGWSTPVKTSAFILNAVGVMSAFYALMRSFGEWNGVCYAIAGIYILSSFSAGIMAVRGHSRYSKAPSAFASMFTGLAFSVMLAAELSASASSAALYLTVMLLVFVNAVYTVRSGLPEHWRIAAGVTSAILGLISVFSTLTALSVNFDGWDAACYTAAILYILQSIAVTIAAYCGHDEYSKGGWAVISQLTGTFFSVIIIAQLAENGACFMLYLTAFAVAYLNFVHTFGFKHPEKWSTALKVFSYILGFFGLVFTVCQMCGHSEWTYRFYITSAVYIAYSAAITAMAFLKHGEYSKTRWAVISQLTGIVLSLCVIGKLAYPSELFVLIFAAFASLYSAAAYLSFMKLPEKWVSSVNTIDIILGIAAAGTAAVLAAVKFGSWDIYCFLIALLYIGYTALRGIRNENSMLKAAESFLGSVAAYNLCCAAADHNIAVPEFFLVCILLAITLIHHFAKPLRTLFSDIYLPTAMTFSAIVCASEHNALGIAGFALLGTAMLIKSAERDGRLSAVFKALLPVPVTGMVFTFVYCNVSNLFADMAAFGAAALAIAAAAIMFIRKKEDAAFYSFAFTAAAMLFIGTATELTAVLAVLLGISILLTVLFCRCGNNLPSLLTMAGTAAVTYRLTDIASLRAEFNVSLLFAVIFAMLSLAASRLLYSRKLLTREEGRLRLDTCCAGMLLALPMIRSANDKVTVFAILVILSVFAANLVRKEHKGSFNRAALTAASGLFTLALIFRPFLIVSDSFVSRKITLCIICAFGFAFSKIWAEYPVLSENFSSAVYGVCFVSLIIDALSHQNLLNTLIVLGTSAAILLYSFISKKKRWFAVSSVSLTGLTVYMFRDFFAMIDWWVYLLIVGFILIAVSSANEYFVRKGKELKEKAGRFFEDWKW